MDLLLRDEHGEPQLIMQADESLYLHPDRAKLPAAAMVVGEDDFPDVVLEVDHTTDARRGKLSLYESWGFPEVWVDVPDASSPKRPRELRPGLTIHLLEDGRYRVAAESHAFPGWTAVADSRGAERACAFGADERGAGACGWSAGRAGRNFGPGRHDPQAALAGRCRNGDVAPDVQRTHAGDRRDRLRGPRREDCRGGGRLEGGLRPFGVRRRRHPRSSPDQSACTSTESDITDLAGNALRVPRPPTTIVLPSSAATPR